MATPEEMNLFAEKILAPVGEMDCKLPNSKLTGFLATKGHRYSHDLMVVGRSVNGWTEGILPDNLADRGSRERYASTVYESVRGDERCPMAWVMDQWGQNDGLSPSPPAFCRTICTQPYKAEDVIIVDFESQ